MKYSSSTTLFAITSVIALNLLIPSIASAGIFKCTNKAGKIFYNDKPCPTNHNEKKIKAVKDPKNGYIPAPIPTVSALSEEQAERKAELENDNFGTPQYKGKETANQRAGRLKDEEMMLKREEVKKELVEALEKEVEALKENGELEKAEKLMNTLKRI